MNKNLRSNRTRKTITLYIILCIVLSVSGELLFLSTPSNVIKIFNQTTTTEDGVVIYYDVFEPKSHIENQSLKKAVILGHGFTVNKEVMRLAALDLANEGFVAVCFDFRSHGRSGGNFDFMGEETIEKIKDDNYSDLARFEGLRILTNDLYAIKNYLTQRGDIEISTLGYVGYSMGGAPGFVALTNDTDFKAMVGWAPNTDVGDVNMTNPQNLLLILGQFDVFTNFKTLSKIMANKTGVSKEEIIPNHQYGSFSDGSAAKISLIKGADHYLAGYNPMFIKETTEWMKSALMNNIESPTSSSYRILMMSIIFQMIGMIGLFLLFSQFLVSHIAIKSSASFIPKINNNTSQERQKTNAIKLFWIPVLFTSYPLMIFVIPLYLTPLLLTGFVLMMLLGPSLAIFLVTKRIFKDMNLKGFSIFKSYIQSTHIKNILLGLVLGLLFYGILILSIGKINGLVPNIEKWKWIPIYFIATLCCFLNVMFYFQTVREESATIPLKSSNVKIIIQNTVHDFLSHFGIVTILFSIPSLLTQQTMIMMLLVPLSIIIFTASFFANYFCSNNKDVWIPAIIISVVTSIFLSILSPIVELSIF